MIDFQGVEFGYGDRPLLGDVTLRLEPGGFYFLTGPSGAGKTTFLRLCTLAAMPRAGMLSIFGDDTSAMDRDRVARLRQRMGMVHQDCQFLDHLSLRDNIALPLDVSGRRKPEHEADIDDLLAWVGLKERAGALPPELSGGERQRAALARAVILSPDILIADEPTGNIDRDMGKRVLDLMIELNKLGRTILVATHDLDLIRVAKASVSARVLRIADRRISLAGAEL